MATPNTPAMRVAWLPVNQRWALVWGDQLVDLDGQRLWECREGLVADLGYKGLAVDRNGTVTTTEVEHGHA